MLCDVCLVIKFAYTIHIVETECMCLLIHDSSTSIENLKD